MRDPHDPNDVKTTVKVVGFEFEVRVNCVQVNYNFLNGLVFRFNDEKLIELEVTTRGDAADDMMNQHDYIQFMYDAQKKTWKVEGS
ncbi:MAG: hypothetical protein KZQ66_19525 [Candidatus Thiodiazotropha sp. (ex Lucinoma aequizonata)]|nr:hypothetical protein [Candidatus Thiodiazotropha sp. (ex Lucinoma aequizonata)]MCU7894194.1 hypothetical protein [Candidatus Thiodiazotropha sp. (ex Lucinoma aequizonata)]MCU7899291.1 hypothetical protein [Candidatus Thiodiazotropha sp. (ex Lucinoma aequizonata)]MCU7903893.1 hypothetical protein [Candidatus Thiodiazotropha sp. (ex Lucinoma aequizonata)]